MIGDAMDQVPAAAPPSGPPTCSACPEPALVQWRRRNVEDPDHIDAVYACGLHAITLDAAALVHRPDCPAPDPKLLPDCGCTPEPAPEPESIPGGGPTTTLPTGWVIPATEAP
jgi:hypothetical protein